MIALIVAVLFDGLCRAAQCGQTASNSITTPTSTNPGPGLTSLVSVGWAHTVAVRSSSTRTIGANTFGQLGDGTFVDKNTWVAGPSVNAVDLTSGGNFTCARTSSGVRCWGLNAVRCSVNHPFVCVLLKFLSGSL